MKTNTFFLICILLIVSSCGDWAFFPQEFFPKVKNNCGHDIGVYLQGEDFCPPTYPDTSIAYTNEWAKYRWASGSISASWGLSSRHLSREKAMKERIHDISSSDTVSFFVFHSDTLDKYDWETIRSEYKILVRYDLTADYFVENDTIWFPPNEKMRNVKMFPSYEQVKELYGN